MNIEVNWTYLVLAIIINVGLIEWAKGIFTKAPVVLWSVLSPAVSLGIAIAADGGLFQIATNALAIWALSQLSYQMVVQTVGKLVMNLITKMMEPK